MEITAKEIERQAGRLEVQTDKAIRVYNMRINELYTIGTIVESEDSNLAATVRRFKDTYQNVSVQMDRKFKNLASVMHQYAANTIANENDTSSAVQSINANLSAIEDSLASSNDEGLGSER